MRTKCGLMLACTWLACAHAQGPDALALRELGLAEYETGHYAAAARQFRGAAALGDARSAEMLVLMQRFDATLYGGQVGGNAAESAHWAAKAAELRGAVATASVLPTR